MDALSAAEVTNSSDFTANIDLMSNNHYQGGGFTTIHHHGVTHFGAPFEDSTFDDECVGDESPRRYIKNFEVECMMEESRLKIMKRKSQKKTQFIVRRSLKKQKSSIR